jgi:hypothetical protein
MDAKNRQPLYDWARLQQGLAALVAREPSQARQAFQDVENAGRIGFAPEDSELAKFFLATARALAAPARISAASVQLNRDSFEAFAPFPFALKNISQADVDDATPLLEQFVNSRPQGKYNWIADYKPLAQKYLEDSRSYAAWKKDAGSAEKSARLEKLRQIKNQLKTRSAISEEINAEEKTLMGQMSNQQRAESNVREQEQKKRAQQFAQKKPQWLKDWKTKLIDDLNRKHFAGAITDTLGTPYTGIDGANAETLTLKLPYGTVQAAWAKLSPVTLLAVSKSFIQPSAADAADRQWLAAIYAAESGQTDMARQLADAAAKAKSDYQEQISFLFP